MSKRERKRSDRRFKDKVITEIGNLEELKIAIKTGDFRNCIIKKERKNTSVPG